MRVYLVLALGLFAAGCGNQDRIEGDVNNDPDAEIDTTGPEIDHTPITAAQPIGGDVLVEARASDESGIFNMTLYYRQETSVLWKQFAMLEVGDVPNEDEDLPPWTMFQGQIRGEDVGSGGMLYFFSAIDDSDQGNASCLGEDNGTVIEDCEPEAWHFPVVPN